MLTGELRSQVDAIWNAFCTGGISKRPSAWDEVSDWIDREGAIANADVVRIARVDTLKASKMLIGWREQGLLVALPGRAKRNMAYTKPSAADSPASLLSALEDNDGGGS